MMYTYEWDAYNDGTLLSPIVVVSLMTCKIDATNITQRVICHSPYFQSPVRLNGPWLS